MQQEQFNLHSAIEDRHWWFTARRRILVRVLEEYLTPDPEKLVVEVGCGTGGNLAELSTRYTCIGIDTSLEAVRAAREKVPESRIVHGTAPEDLADYARQADAFLLLDVLEHVRDDVALFSKLVQVAKVGCLFLITVPANPGLWSQHDVAFGHFRRYDRERLERVWKDLPVEVRLLSYYNSRLYPLIWAVRKINRLRSRSWGEAQTDFSLPPRPLNKFLHRFFSNESHTLLASKSTSTRMGFRRGVSLICLLQRGFGNCVLATKPAHLQDTYDPETGGDGAV